MQVKLGALFLVSLIISYSYREVLLRTRPSIWSIYRWRCTTALVAYASLGIHFGPPLVKLLSQNCARYREAPIFKQSRFKYI